MSAANQLIVETEVKVRYGGVVAIIKDGRFHVAHINEKLACGVELRNAFNSVREMTEYATELERVVVNLRAVAHADQVKR